MWVQRFRRSIWTSTEDTATPFLQAFLCAEISVWHQISRFFIIMYKRNRLIWVCVVTKSNWQHFAYKVKSFARRNRGPFPQLLVFYVSKALVWSSYIKGGGTCLSDAPPVLPPLPPTPGFLHYFLSLQKVEVYCNGESESSEGRRWECVGVTACMKNRGKGFWYISFHGIPALVRDLWWGSTCRAGRWCFFTWFTTEFEREKPFYRMSAQWFDSEGTTFDDAMKLIPKSWWQKEAEQVAFAM